MDHTKKLKEVADTAVVFNLQISQLLKDKQAIQELLVGDEKVEFENICERLTKVFILLS